MTPKNPTRFPDGEIPIGTIQGSLGIENWNSRVAYTQVTYGGGVAFGPNPLPWEAIGYRLNTVDSNGNVNLETAGDVTGGILSNAYLVWHSNQPYGSLLQYDIYDTAPNKYEVYVTSYTGRFSPNSSTIGPIDLGIVAVNLSDFNCFGGFYNGSGCSSFWDINFGGSDPREIYIASAGGLLNCASMPDVEYNAIFGSADNGQYPMAILIGGTELNIFNYDPNTGKAVFCASTPSGFAIHGSFTNTQYEFEFDGFSGATVLGIAGANEDSVFYLIDENGGTNPTGWLEVSNDGNFFRALVPTDMPVDYVPGGYVRLGF